MFGRTIGIVAVALLVAASAHASALGTRTVLDYRATIEAGAERILELQWDDGGIPTLPDHYPQPNVVGAIGHGLLEAFKVTGHVEYLGEGYTGAAGARQWLVDWVAANPDGYISQSSIFFLAEYALVTANPADMTVARDQFEKWMDYYGSPEAFVDAYLARGNSGVWNLGRWIRAAHDIGADATAAAMADRLATQQTVDVLSDTANWNEYGISGFIFGLAESDLLAHREAVAQARDELLTRQCENGAFSFTYSAGGRVHDACDAVQSTAMAIMALVYIGDLASIGRACDYLVDSQQQNGGWTWSFNGVEYVQTGADALTALAMCTLPARNGVTSYADPALALY